MDDAKTIPLRYMLDKDFTKNFFKSTLLTSFPELTGDVRKDFFTEFIDRVKVQSVPVRLGNKHLLFCGATLDKQIHD